MLHKLLVPLAANVTPLLDDPWPPAGARRVCNVEKQYIYSNSACMGLLCYWRVSGHEYEQHLHMYACGT